MINSFLTALGSKIILALLISSTLVTTGIAVTKVAESFNSPEIPKEGLPIAPEVKTTNAPTPTEIIDSIVNSVKKIVSPVPTKKLVTNAFPTAVAVTPTLSVKENTLCIVTLFGVQYDVSNLMTTHSGGNVFKCGTDQTALYTSRHGTNMSRMTAYKYTGTSNTSTIQTTNPTLAPTNGSEKRYSNEEREDNEHEDRYVKSEDSEENDD